MILESARDVIKKEAEAVAGLLDRLDENFEKAVRAILTTSGRVIVTGIGKSGLVGRKIAATFASTGTPSLFLHPTEAFHGDLGIVTENDIVLAISKSGDTSELHQLIPAFKRLGLQIILLTGEIDSPLAERSDIVIDCSVKAEACPNNLVPTSSSTAALVMGDALAVALLRMRGFSTEDFAKLHPGGALGRRLLVRVSDVMHTGDKVPIVSESTTVLDTLITMSRGRLGTAVVVDGSGRMLGVFTDGDLRRLSERGEQFYERRIGDVMTRNARTINPDAILDEVLALCEKYKITVLVAVDKDHRPVGIIHLHDVLTSKLV
ncbi:MAG: KpsF/GutQ family sugar-phosphate isomerase [candidate division Zixibacteria bacterium]|nr:KpsF/GutQ family sugar-phosphate isomerase [candidate division Zixibacteria bacterium]